MRGRGVSAHGSRAVAYVVSSTPLPNTLTLRELERRGYTAALVESRIAGGRISRDLFGCIDVVGVGAEGTVAVQATSLSNIASRIRKVEESPALAAMRAAGWTILVHGWRAGELRREVDVS
jgi:hypothetical protein